MTSPLLPLLRATLLATLASPSLAAPSASASAFFGASASAAASAAASAGVPAFVPAFVPASVPASGSTSITSVAASAAASGAASAGVPAGLCYARETCRSVCQYGGSYLSGQCRRCYPGLCPNVQTGRSVPPTSTPAPYYEPVDAPSCLDQFGQRREAQASWVDNELYPCVLYTCPANGGDYTVDNLGADCPVEPVDLGDCTPSRNVGQCCFNYTCHSGPDDSADSCIDSSGQLRHHGEEWNDDDDYPCSSYKCVDGEVKQLVNLQPGCDPPPSSQCQLYRAVGDCCYSFNCSITISQALCRDAAGSYRREGDFWYDDVTHPCVKYVCRAGGQIDIEYDLKSSCAPPPRPSCQAWRAAGACCYNYTCGCDYNGATREEGEEFVDDVEHPCQLLSCRDGAVVTVAPLDVCAPITCAAQVHPVGECCKRCASCLFDGVEYQEDDPPFYDDPKRPCKQYRCESGQAVLVRDESLSCPPAPDAHCTPWHMEGLCCPKWDCEEQPCMIGGVKHDHGTTWPEDPQRPCKHLICNNSAVLTFSEEPPCAPAPYPHCIQREVPYQCCPDWDCVSTKCRYGSDPVQLYSEGQKWYDDASYPCKQFTCTKAGVVKTLDLLLECAPLDPPDCRTERLLGECCKRCIPQPLQCSDGDGGRHDLGESYFEDPTTQCVLVRCLQNSTVTIYDRRRNCPRDPRLTNPRCSQVDTKDCCPVYHCPACEYHSRQYQNGDKWWDSDERQCTRYMCGYDGISTTVFTRLPCPPVRDGCVANYRGYECCHYKYTCMFDPQDNLIPMPQPGIRSFKFDG